MPFLSPMLSAVREVMHKPVYVRSHSEGWQVSRDARDWQPFPCAIAGRSKAHEILDVASVLFPDSVIAISSAAGSASNLNRRFA